MSDPRAIVRLLKMHQAHRRKLSTYATQLREQVTRAASKLSSFDDHNTATNADSEWPALELAAVGARELPPHVQKTLLSGLPVHLADELERAIYSFDALPTLPRRAIQEVLRLAVGRDVALALIGAGPELEAAVLDNVSARKATIIREDRESLIASGEIAGSDVDAARERLARIIRAAGRRGEVR